MTPLLRGRTSVWVSYSAPIEGRGFPHISSLRLLSCPQEPRGLRAPSPARYPILSSTGTWILNTPLTFPYRVPTIDGYSGYTLPTEPVIIPLSAPLSRPGIFHVSSLRPLSSTIRERCQHDTQRLQKGRALLRSRSSPCCHSLYRHAFAAVTTLRYEGTPAPGCQ